MDVKFGDLVQYDLTKSHGGKPEEAYVIGFNPHSRNGDLPVVATETGLGMPINKGHCIVLSSGHSEVCARLRQRFLDRYPEWLQPRE